jgi:hypothetical protein
MESETLIVGGYLNTDLINVKHIDALSGTIGGISIYGKSLGTQTESSTARGIYLDTSMLRFIGWVDQYQTKAAIGLRSTPGWANYDSYLYVKDETRGSDSTHYYWKCGLFVSFSDDLNTTATRLDSFIVGKYSTGASEREFSVFVSSTQAQDAGDKTIFIRASRMPVLSQLNYVNSCVNSGGNNTFNVKWDQRTGCLYIEQ